MAAFVALSSGLQESTDANQVLMPPSALQNQHDRFRIWCGNLGALQHGRASLDSRLRDSPLMRTTVGKLLGQLKATLQRSMLVSHTGMAMFSSSHRSRQPSCLWPAGSTRGNL